MRMLRQKGDTIVEVLIAMAVISSVLAITYSTMNRNLQLMRGNQERTEASRLAQGQVEQLKALWLADEAAVAARGTSPFCINSGAISTTCVATIYNYSITRDTTDSRLYRIRVVWTALNGVDSQVNSVYRLQ